MANTQLNTNNIHVYGDININVWTAPLTAPAPSPYPAAPGAGWGALGWLDSDAGIVQSVSRTETQKYGMQGASLIRTIRSQEQRPWTFTALEENPVTQTLLNPFGTTTSSSGTATVQTVTIAGTPTGGTFGLASIFGASAGNAYNISQSALQTALQTAWGIAVTVSLSGAVYTITFPQIAGIVPLISASNQLTGGTSPTVTPAVSTVGTLPANSTTQLAVTSVNFRQFAIDLISGSVAHRYWFASAEATQSGDIKYDDADFAAYAFTLTPYANTLNGGGFWTDLNNNPELASGLFS